MEGVDVSPDAVEKALSLARGEGVHIRVRVEDLEKIPRFEEDSYDLVICFNYLQRSLIPQLKNWVKAGGMVVYETFIIDQVRCGRAASSRASRQSTNTRVLPLNMADISFPVFGLTLAATTDHH